MNLRPHRGVLRAHLPCASPERRQSGHVLPDRSALTARVSNQGTRVGAGDHLPPLPQCVLQTGPSEKGSARRPFRHPPTRRSVPGTTRSTRGTARDGLAACPPGFRRLLLGPHSPSAGFQTPRRRRPGTGDQSGPRRGSRVSDELHPTDHVGSRCDPAGPSSHVRGFRPGAVATLRQERAFEGQKPEAPLYPSTTVFPCSASSSVELTGKPLTP